MVAKTTLYFGEQPPITAPTSEQRLIETHFQDEWGTGLLVLRGIFAGERGIADSLHPTLHIGAETSRI